MLFIPMLTSSYLEEELVNLPALSKFGNAYFTAAEEYMPSGPPESPITGSYFSLWGIFDLILSQQVQKKKVLEQQQLTYANI